MSAYLAGAAGGLGAAGSAAGGGVAEGAAVPFCGPGSSCAQVWSSPFGRLAGLPLPVWGLGMFLLLVAGGVAWWRAATRPWPPGAARAVRALTLAGAWLAGGFAVYLVGLQAAVLRAWCPWCLAADSMAVVAAAFFTAAARHGVAAGAAGAGAGGPGGGQGTLPGGKASRGLRPAGPWRWSVAAAAGVVLAAGVAGLHWTGAGAAAGTAGLPGEAGPSPEGTATAVRAGRLPRSLQELEPLVSAGPAGAPVRVDVYADFQCPYCARAAREVLTPLLEQEVREGRMRVVFHNFAFLGAESVWAARAAVCAAVQGRFWPYHDRLFAAQRAENSGVYRVERLVEMARREGLEVESFQACLQRPEVRRLVEASYEEGRQRGVRATPTFFVNGQMVEGLVPVEELRRIARSRQAQQP